MMGHREKDLLDKKALIEAFASLELEGKTLPPKIKDLIYKATSGQISDEEFDKLAMEYVRMGK